jgi:hypothetical protein
MPLFAVPRIAAASCWTLLASLVAVTTVAAQQPPLQRRLAEGVVTVIPSDPQDGETFHGPLPLVELTTGRANLDWTPPQFPNGQPHLTAKSQTLKEMASKVVLRHPIWNLEFAFKPVRMIEVDIPQPSGKMQRTPVWYMVYKVTYRGNDLTPSAQLPDARQSIDEDLEAWKFELFPSTSPVSSASQRFFPHFVLESRLHDKQYFDRVIPAAKFPILLREFPSKQPGVPEFAQEQFYNSVEIGTVPLLPSDAQTDRGVWGFVTWQDIDPRIDFFSLYIRGLTNAFQFRDMPGAYKEGDPPATGRKFAYKTLKLNFYRPGDALHEHEGELRFGVPVVSDPGEQAKILEQYGLRERVDYLWIYR